jgi:2-phospho-L-lactate guanylyltransferase (CobY/MobA/RfbA family)
MSPAERARVAEVMLESTLEIATQTRLADRIAMVTLFEPAIVLARRYGIEVIIEKEQYSESRSIDYGTGELVRAGATSILRLPIDLPLLRVEDIDRILEHERSCRRRSPFHRVTALVRMRCCVARGYLQISLRTRAAQHLAAAEQAGIDCEVMRLPRIALDMMRSMTSRCCSKQARARESTISLQR